MVEQVSFVVLEHASSSQGRYHASPELWEFAL